MIVSSHQGAREVALPIFASTFTTCAVFLPVIYVQGVAGRLFRDYSLTLTFSLLTSILTALLLLPVLASRFKGRQSFQDLTLPITGPIGQKKKYRSDRSFFHIPIFNNQFVYRLLLPVQRVYKRLTGFVFSRFNVGFEWIYDQYHELLLLCLARKKETLLLLVALFVLTLGLGWQLARRLLPSFTQDEFRLYLELPVDATVTQTAETARAIETQLLTEPTVVSVFSRIGPLESALQTDEITGEHQAVLFIRRRPGVDISNEAYIARLRALLPRHYEYRSWFQSGDPTFMEMVGAVGRDLQLDISGTDSREILSVAQTALSSLKEFDWCRDARLSYLPGISQYEISIDRERAAMMDIDPARITQLLQSASEGLVATRMREMDRAIDILVRPSLEWRDSWRDLYQRFLIVNQMPVPLRELIHIRQTQAPEHILRQDQQETIRLYASLDNISRAEAMRRINRRLASLAIPSGVRIISGGEQQEIDSSFQSLKWAFILSVLLIFLILAAQFESLKYPFLILFSVPYGMIGAIWALALCGTSLNIISGIGFVVLTGIVVNDDIIKIDFINQNRRQGMGVREAILDASRKRFRPIVITTLTTMLGVLPMALARGHGAEMQYPMALVIMGGLFSGTFLTLILIPVFYELFTSDDKRSIDEHHSQLLINDSTGEGANHAAVD